MNPEDFDDRRFPFEATRAIDRAGLLVDQLEQGLCARNEGDEVVLTVRDGREVGRIPLYRLAAVDPDLLAAEVTRGIPPRVANRLRVLIRAGEGVIDDPADEYVTVQLSEHASHVLHRSLVVPDWPDWVDDEEGFTA